MDLINIGSRLYHQGCFCMVALDITFLPAHILQGINTLPIFFCVLLFPPSSIAPSPTLRALMFHPL